jgi:hypothetical protein
LSEVAGQSAGAPQTSRARDASAGVVALRRGFQSILSCLTTPSARASVPSHCQHVPQMRQRMNNRDRTARRQVRR